jgi:hypothetical protein
LDKLERNKDIKHKHGNEIYMIEIFVIIILWKRIILCLWVHVGVRLDVLWKWNIVFLWVLENDFILTIVVTPILVDHKTSCVEKIIYLSFHAYKKCSNRRSYASCALIWRQGGPGLRIGNKYGKYINVIWIKWKETSILNINIAKKYMWLKDL